MIVLHNFLCKIISVVHILVSKWPPVAILEFKFDLFYNLIKFFYLDYLFV